MAKTKWEPAAFYLWYEKLPIHKRVEAWDDVSREQQKLYIEWKTFRAFALASGLDIDLRSIENCDPSVCSPPLPDFRCAVSGRTEYFEIGEITDEALARKASLAVKNRQKGYGGPFLQRQPLLRIFLKKCRNHYTTNGFPLHLVLHFSVGRQSPFESMLREDVTVCHERLVQRIKKSQFQSAWIYDDWQKQILVRLQR